MKVYKSKSKELLDTESFERFLTYILFKTPKRCVVDYIDYVFELEESYIKFIQISEYSKESELQKFQKLLQYYSKGTYPKSIEKIQEFFLNKYFMENPHKNIASPTNSFLLYNLTNEHIELYAGIEMPKYHSLQEANFDDWTDHTKVTFLKGLIEGVINIHKIHYFHGDLKPLNICYDNEYVAKIIDFGKSDKLDCRASFTNSFGFCPPTQMYYWMNDPDDGVTKDGNYKFEQIILNDLLDTYGLLEESVDENGNLIIIPKDKFMKNDFFTIGLIIIFVYGNKKLFFYQEDESGDSILTFIDCYIKFLRNPREYLSQVLEKVSIPDEMKTFVNFYILGYFDKIN